MEVSISLATASRTPSFLSCWSPSEQPPPSLPWCGERTDCSPQMVNSPRALVFNADPIAHPPRSPSLRAAWEPDSNNGRGRSAWGTDSYLAKRAPQVGGGGSDCTAQDALTVTPYFVRSRETQRRRLFLCDVRAAACKEEHQAVDFVRHSVYMFNGGRLL